MDKKITILGGDTNALIVKISGRHNPGIVIQMDSFNNIFNLISEALKKNQDGEMMEAMDVIKEVLEILQSYNNEFKAVGFI